MDKLKGQGVNVIVSATEANGDGGKIEGWLKVDKDKNCNGTNGRDNGYDECWNIEG